MRQTFRSWSLGACLLALVFGGPAALAEEELATGSFEYPTAQLIGWSRDEERYAFRVFAHKEVDGLESESEEAQKASQEVDDYNAGREDADGFCKGYLDHKGKRFKGSLQLVVFERDKHMMTLPIQDEPRCTDSKVAATRLGEAKKQLLELGIDTSRVGKDFFLESGKKIDLKPEKQPPYAVEYVSRLRDMSEDPPKGEEEDADPTQISLRGTLELYVHKGGKKQKVYTQKVSRDGTRLMGGSAEESLAYLHVSPSGTRLVVLGTSRVGDGRSGFNSSLTLATVVGWPKAVIAKDK